MIEVNFFFSFFFNFTSYYKSNIINSILIIDTTPKIPYQLLRPYKGKRVIKPPVKWTPEEDEVIYKFIIMNFFLFHFIYLFFFIKIL